MLRLLLVCFGLAVIAKVSAEEKPKLPPKEKMHLFLLIGQSNMSGRGKMDDEDKKSHPRVWTLNKDGEWAPAIDPIHFDKPKLAGVGPGVPFGKYLAEKMEDVHIGLIPCAVGGSSINQWGKDTPFRKSAVERTHKAMESGKLSGILWHQGESDVKTSETYLGRLELIIKELRQEFKDPELPFIVGELGEWPKSPDGTIRINLVLNDLESRVSRTGCASSAQLLDQDGVHFDAASQRILGKRYADEYLRVIAKKKDD